MNTRHIERLVAFVGVAILAGSAGLAHADPEGALDTPATDSVDGTGLNMATDPAIDSVDGTGLRRGVVDGTDSVDGTGLNQAISEGTDSVDGTGLRRTVAEGIDSVDGTGLQVTPPSDLAASGEQLLTVPASTRSADCVPAADAMAADTTDCVPSAEAPDSGE